LTARRIAQAIEAFKNVVEIDWIYTDPLVSDVYKVITVKIP
jgi:hypothetical protein